MFIKLKLIRISIFQNDGYVKLEGNKPYRNLSFQLFNYIVYIELFFAQSFYCCRIHEFSSRWNSPYLVI